MSLTTQILNDNQVFLLNGENLSGVSSLSLGYRNPFENSPALGDAGFGFFLNGNIESSVEFSRQLIYQDPLLNYTGDISLAGEFVYGGKSYSFASGYLTNYSVSCSVGQIPQVSANVSVWAGMNSGQNNLAANIGEGIFIPSQRSIEVSGLDFATNRVRSFNYSLDISRQPIYSIEGGREAESVNFVPPIEISASVELEIGASFARNSYAATESFFDDSVIISVKDRTLQNNLATFTVYNAKLLGETLQTDANGQPVKNLTFGGFLA